MAKIDYDAQCKRYLEKVEHYQEKLKKSLAAKKKHDRAKRTKRLIQIGADIEKALGLELTDAQRELFILWIYTQQARGKYVTLALNGNTNSFSEKYHKRVSELCNQAIPKTEEPSTVDSDDDGIIPF